MQTLIEQSSRGVWELTDADLDAVSAGQASARSEAYGFARGLNSADVETFTNTEVEYTRTTAAAFGYSSSASTAD